MKRRDPNWRWLRALGSKRFLIKRSTAEKGSTAMREIDQEKIFHAFLKVCSRFICLVSILFDSWR